MQAVGKIEEETVLTDLDQLEKSIEGEIADTVNNDNAPQPPVAVAQVAAPAAVMGMRASKFAGKGPQMRSAFFPGQAVSVSKLIGSQSIMPVSRFMKRGKMQPANDIFGVSKFMPALRPAPAMSVSRFVRKSIDVLLALGAVPEKLLEDLGLFRYTKERQYNSLLRIEHALGQGYEDAEQFLRMNPGAERKKSLPAPAGP